MAIKISNVTVIDDSRNITNAETLVFESNTVIVLPAGGTDSRPVSPANGSIRYNTDDNAFEGYAAGVWGSIGGGGDTFNTIQTPTNTTPANGETNVDINPTLAATNIRHIYNKDKAYGVWQISNNALFTSTALNANVASSTNSYSAVSANLSYETTYYWRVKYGDSNNNESDFSTPTQFTTAIAPPTVLGQTYQGGFYTGTISTAGATYYLIVAPNSTGCACCQWKCTRTCSNVSCLSDGYFNTYTCMADPTHRSANWTATRTIGGYSDWYMPSRCELNQMYLARFCMPPGEGYILPGARAYWSSNEDSALLGCHQYFDTDGTQNCNDKDNSCPVRAIRRVPI